MSAMMVERWLGSRGINVHSGFNGNGLEFDLITKRAAIRIRHWQPFTRIGLVEADAQRIDARFGIHKNGNLKVSSNQLAWFPLGGRAAGATWFSVQLPDHFILRANDLIKQGVIRFDPLFY